MCGEGCWHGDWEAGEVGGCVSASWPLTRVVDVYIIDYLSFLWGMKMLAHPVFDLFSAAVWLLV